MTEKYITMEQYHRKTGISKEMLDFCMRWATNHLARERKQQEEQNEKVTEVTRNQDGVD